MVLFEAISLICCFFLIFPLGSTIAALLMPHKVYVPNEKLEASDFACVITVYKDLGIAWPLVKSLLKQQYPDFHIYLVADAVDNKQPDDRKVPGLTVFSPEKPLNSKVASLAYALEHMDQRHTHVVVFDPDNLVPDHFLEIMDLYHAAGFKAVQGKRIAKNIAGTYAALDALGEYYYDFAVRNVPFRLGASSTIAGSGMSIAKALYEENISNELLVLREKGVVVAEDKSLQLQLVKAGHRIAYAPAAIVFDEKISSHEQIGRQRGRWLNSYFGHFIKAFGALWKGFFRLDWNLVLFSVTVLMPPMIVLIGGSIMLMAIGFFLNSLYVFLLMGSLVIFSGSFVLILIFNRTPTQVMKAIFSIPYFVWGQLSGFMNIRKANKDFMATSHNQILEIEDIWTDRQQEFSHLTEWRENFLRK